jgi:hypothetical protein
LPALQAASRVVQEQFIKDAQIVPDLGDLLNYCETYWYWCNSTAKQIYSQLGATPRRLTRYSPVTTVFRFVRGNI